MEAFLLESIREDHKQSKAHRKSAEAYFLRASKSDIGQTYLSPTRAGWLWNMQSSHNGYKVELRYVTDFIHERLIAILDCESSTGEYFAEFLNQTGEDINIKAVGNSTD